MTFDRIVVHNGGVARPHWKRDPILALGGRGIITSCILTPTSGALTIYAPEQVSVLKHPLNRGVTLKRPRPIGLRAIVWLTGTDEEWTPRWTPNRRDGAVPDSELDLVSILVSIFRPNRGDLVDFRDFGDCVSFR